jgi:hypothetical protein
MSGYKRLDSDIRQEMLKDASDLKRRQGFRAARRKSDQCDLDEYISFLSECMESVASEPKKTVTQDFKL